MRVEVVESLSENRPANAAAAEDASVKLAVQNFQNAIKSDDSLFACPETRTGPITWAAGGHGTCVGEFLVTFRDEETGRNRGMYFQLLQKLAELLKKAGSLEVLTARLCLIPGGQKEIPKGTFALEIRLEAAGDSSEQAALRWGLGLAHLQQALLFTSRFLRQQSSAKNA
jgi:hypothetical protein